MLKNMQKPTLIITHSFGGSVPLHVFLLVINKLTASAKGKGEGLGPGGSLQRLL